MTPSQLAQATGAPLERAARWLPYISAAMDEYGINTPERKAMFLAQIGHESGSLRYSEEIWGPTAAQQTYEGRINLGNTVPGDGYRFRGRGLIQTTGRANYLATSQALGVDFIANPEKLGEPDNASKSAAWFWQAHGLNELADAGSFETITRRINGGLNGLDDRNKRYAAARLALVDVVEEAQATAVPTPAPAGFGAFLAGLVQMFLRKKA